MKAFHEKVVGWIASAQAYTKFWVAVAGGLLVIISANIPIPEDWSRWITTSIAILTAFSVFQFPNKVPDVVTMLPKIHIGQAEMDAAQAEWDKNNS